MLSLHLFVVNSKNKFEPNSDVWKHNFHQPLSNSSLYQKEVYSVGMKMFNSLPQCIKNLSDNPKAFKSALRNT